MALLNIFKPRRTALSVLILVPFAVSAAGFDVYSVSRDHSVEVSTGLVSASRIYWYAPDYVEDESDSKRRRVRLLQNNEDPDFGPVSDWSNEINLQVAVNLPGNTIATQTSSKVFTEVSDSAVWHRAELSYEMQKDGTWTDRSFATARTEFVGAFYVTAPQDVLIEAYVSNDGGMPGLQAGLRRVDNWEMQWAINWPMHTGDDFFRPPGAEYIYDWPNTTLRVTKLLTLAPGEYEFHSYSRSGYDLSESPFNYDSAGTTFFSITAVPETESVAMALAGLVVMGAVWRTRRPGEGVGN